MPLIPPSSLSFAVDASNRLRELAPQPVLPSIRSMGRTHRVKVGETLTLPCHVEHLGPYVLLWKKGHRVVTAGKVIVRRDRRIALIRHNLQITGKFNYSGPKGKAAWDWVGTCGLSVCVQ